MSHWRISDWTFGLLATLAVMAAWEGYVLNNRPETRGCGGDFPQFYFAGKIVSQNEAQRLYDQPYFRQLQESMRDDPLRSLYPPTMALFMAPFARLPYHEALAVWWGIQALCLLASGLIFYRILPLPKVWRINSLVALSALLPIWIAVGIGHLAPVLLLILAGGITLHKRGRNGWAGLLLSILALKPQLSAGLVLWMLVRRDVGTLLGLASGFALQFLIVAAVLGPGLWLDYLHALPEIAAITRAYRYSPLFEQSFAGMLSNQLWAAGLTQWQAPAMRIAHAVTAAAAAAMLCRVIWARQPTRTGSVPGGIDEYEYACGVLFMMILPPYFLVYDQTLLAVPLVMLWSSPAWKWGVILFATATVVIANLSFTIGFSLTGFVALAAMLSLGQRVRSQSYEAYPCQAGSVPIGH